MYKEFDITVDLIKETRMEKFVVNTNDLKTLKFNFTITRDEIPFDITGTTVRIAVRKPDQKTVLQDCTVTAGSMGKCEAILTNQAYLVPAEHKAELMIFRGDTNVATTRPFAYVSRRGIMDDESLESTNEFPVLQKAIDAGEILKNVSLEDIRNNTKNVESAVKSVDNVQKQIDILVVNGDSSVEAAQMRVDTKGITHPTAKARADSDFNEITTNIIGGKPQISMNPNSLWDEVQQRGINVKWFGAKGDGETDDTQALLKAIAYAKTRLPCTLLFPKGTYCYTDLGNLAYTGLSFEGMEDREVLLKCISNVPNHIAILFDAFALGVNFVYRSHMKNIKVKGNTNTKTVFKLQGIAWVSWENVFGYNAKEKVFHLLGVMLSNFKYVGISANLDTFDVVPQHGLYIERGTRSIGDAGASTNDVFTNCYFENVNIGIETAGADQVVFISGSAEANNDKGVVIGSGDRMTTFMNAGFEKNASGIDIIDNGRMTQFINCYTDKTIKLMGQQCKISGGLYGSVNITSDARNSVVENIRVNYHQKDDGGFINNGYNTSFRNIYDLNPTVNKMIYPTKPRTGLTVTASPFTWKNDTGRPVEIIAQAGTVSQVMGRRLGASDWLRPTTVPNSYRVEPDDSIIFTYTGTLALSYLEHNGY